MFRRLLRQKKYKYENDNMQTMAESQELDQRYFWYCVNKNKRSTNVKPPILDENNELVQILVKNFFRTLVYNLV